MLIVVDATHHSRGIIRAHTQASTGRVSMRVETFMNPYNRPVRRHSSVDGKIAMYTGSESKLVLEDMHALE